MIVRQKEEYACTSFSVKPKKKYVNEDFYVNEKALLPSNEYAYLSIIADGMGGHDDGDVASFFAVHHVLRWWRSTFWFMEDEKSWFQEIQEQLIEQFKDINHRLIAAGNREQKKIGTTLSVLILVDGKYIIGHVGDSKIYRYRQDTSDFSIDDDTIDLHELDSFIQLTEDHARKVYRAGEMVQSHVLTQCMGIKGEVSPFIKIGTYEKDDLFLLTTDGLEKVLHIRDVERIIQEQDSTEKRAEILYHQVINKPFSDDVTVTLLSDFC